MQQTFRVKTLVKHSGFTMQNLKHDIAVLQLDRSAQLSDKVTTVCLPDRDADLNSKCYITGLSLTFSRSHHIKKILVDYYSFFFFASISLYETRTQRK